MFDGVMSFKEGDIDFSDRKAEFELLFDLDSDPDERTNLASVAEHADILAELRGKTAAESVAINARREAFKAAVPTKGRVDPPKEGKGKGKK
jgi:hypothetical protein